MLITYLPICRLQKIHLGTRGTHLHMHASNGKPELCGPGTSLRFGSQIAGGAHTPLNVGSTLVMELIDKNFPFSALAGLKTIPGLLPAPYHQIKIITPNINKFEKVDFS